MAAPLQSNLRMTSSGRNREQALQSSQVPFSSFKNVASHSQLALVLSAAIAVVGALCGFFFSTPLHLSHDALHSAVLGLTPLCMSVLIFNQALNVRNQTVAQFCLLEPPLELPTCSVYGISRFAGLAALLLMLASAGICMNTWWGAIFASMLLSFWHLYLVPKIDQQSEARFGLAHRIHKDRTATWI